MTTKLISDHQWFARYTRPHFVLVLVMVLYRLSGFA